jgi:hypothetical protein
MRRLYVRQHRHYVKWHLYYVIIILLLLLWMEKVKRLGEVEPIHQDHDTVLVHPKGRD